MKALKTCFYFFVLAIMALPLNLLAQPKEVPITTSSKEALDLFLKGRDKLENFESSAAASLFDQAIKTDPGFAMAYLYRSQSGGGLNVFRQNLDKAVSLADKVSEGEKYEILYSEASANGDGQKQKECLDWLLENFPSDKRVQMDIAGIYFYNINDFQSALKHFTKAVELDKNYGPAFNMMGYCQASLKNFPEAEKAFQTYIKLSQNSPNGFDSYAELLLKMGKYDESITQYKKALDVDPSFSFSLVGLGNNYIFKGDFATARKYYQEFFDKASSTNEKLSALYWKAVSYVHEYQIESALKTFAEIEELAQKENLPNWEVTSCLNRGFILSETGNPEEGLKYYEKADKLIQESKLPAAMNENLSMAAMLGHFYSLTANGKLQEAEDAEEKCKQKVASRMDPGEEMYLNSLQAFWELKNDHYDRAIEYFSKGNQQSPFTWYYSGLTYARKGDKPNASAMFKKIVESNDNGLNLALYRTRAIKQLKE